MNFSVFVCADGYKEESVSLNLAGRNNIDILLVSTRFLLNWERGVLGL
jgi:hypothetical protein